MKNSRSVLHGSDFIFWDLHMSRKISSNLKHACQNEMASYMWESWNYTQIQSFFSQDEATVLHPGTLILTFSALVANCLFLFSFLLGHSHCSSSPCCLWWGHLQFCYTKHSKDHFQKAFWDGFYCQPWEQAPAATDSPSRGPWEIQSDGEWQRMRPHASKCPLSSSSCLTLCIL